MRIFWGMFFLGLILRLCWAVRQPNDPESLAALPDQVEYLSLGQNLLHHQTLFFYDKRFDQSIYAYRMPGYPIFVALCGGSPLVVRIAQAMIDAGNILAAFLLGRKLLSDRVALIAAAFIAINPFLIYFSGLILSETLCTAMIFWGAVWCFIPLRARGEQRNSRDATPPRCREYVASRLLRNLGGVILIALSVLVRPSGLLLAIFLPIIAEVKRLCIVLGLLVLVLLLILWAWRNDAVLGRWIWTTTNAGITQYDGFNAGATGASDQRFVQQIPYLQQLNEVDRNAYLANLARSYIQQHPRRDMELAMKKLGRTFSPVPLSDQFGRPIYLAIAAAYSCPVFLLAILGIFRNSWGWQTKLFLLCVPIYFAIVHACSVGSLRYRLPAEPFIAVLAASAFERSKEMQNDESRMQNRNAQP